MSLVRHRLAARLLLLVCGTAGFSIALALGFQDRTLQRDLEAAARARLERAAEAADRLAAGHLEAQTARYRAVATPQLRALLEVNHAPTLAHYATSLAARQGAARVVFLDAEGAPLAGGGEVELDAAVAGVEGAALVAHDGRPYAVVSVPLRAGPRRLGRLVAAEPVGEPVLREWSELCGAEVSFAAPGTPEGPGLTAAARDLGPLVLRVASSLDAERGALAHSRWSLLLAGGIALLAAFVLSYFVAQGVMRPIRELQEAAQRIGRGDFTVALASDRRDELGDVARAFESMAGALRRMVGRVASAADETEATAATTASVSDDLARATASQAGEIDEAAASMDEVNRRVNEIAGSARDSADVLNASVEGSSHSLRELVATGSVLRDSASHLAQQVEETGVAIGRMLESARHVAATTGSVSGAADETSQSMQGVATSTREVGENARKNADLSSRVVKLSEQGHGRVSETIEGMRVIREATETARGVIHDLGARVKEIHSIATVIDQVGEQTNLLALNASIIAAQSGESGRAFAVVAGQMKALADHVRTNTEVIHDLVRGIQTESENAVHAIEAGSESVQKGVGLASEAGSSLEEITRAARESGHNANEIVAAVEAQARAAEYVVQLMDRVRAGVEAMRAAGAEQERENEVVLRGAESMQEVSRQVQATTEAQTQGTERIGRDVEAVRGAVERIVQALAEQSEACTRAAGFLERARRHTGDNAEAAGRVGAATGELRAHTESLRGEIRRFRI